MNVIRAKRRTGMDEGAAQANSGRQGAGRAGRNLVAAAGALVAALSLTACGTATTGSAAAHSSGSAAPSVAAVAHVSMMPSASATPGASATSTPSQVGATATTATTPSATPAPVSFHSGAAQQPEVAAAIYDCSGKLVPQPSWVVLTCADAGWVLEQLKWTDSGQPTASASGEWSEKNCKPNCAMGGISKYPATVTVSGLRNGAYTQMSVSAPTSPTPRSVFALTRVGPEFQQRG